jgi:hypothetical protein
MPAVSLTDVFREAEIREKLERGEEPSEQEWRFLDALELELPEAGFEERWP